MAHDHLHEVHVPGEFSSRRRHQIEVWNAQVREQLSARGSRGPGPRGRRAAAPDEIADSVRWAACRHCGAPLKLLPRTNSVPIVRTDFADDEAWRSVVAEALKRSPEGFQAGLEPVDDPAFRGLTVPQVLDRLADDSRFRLLFIVDATTVGDLDHPVIAVDLYDQPGRTLRTLASQVHVIENNVTLGNMAFAEFVDARDSAGGRLDGP